MKNFKLHLILLISILTLSLFGSTFKASNFTLASLEASVSNPSSLLYSPVFITSNETELFVHDEYDETIKIYDKQSTSLRAENNLIEKQNVIKLSVSENFLFVLTSSPSKVEVINTETLETVAELTGEQTPTIDGANNMTTYKTAENNICMVLSKFNSETQENSIEIFNFQNQDNIWAFLAGSSTINASRNLNISTKINNISIAQSSIENNFYLIFSSEKSVYSFLFEPTAQPLTSYDVSNSGLAIQNEILSLNRLSYNNNNYLCVSTQSEIYIYVENINNKYSLNYELTHEKNLTNFTDFCSQDNVIYLTNPHEQTILSLTLIGEELNLEFEENEFIKNDELTNTSLEVSDFEYFVTTTKAQMFSSPFSSTLVLSEIPQNSHVCKISTTNVGDFNLTNFIYCMFTTNTQNYYGYVKTENLEKLNASTYNQNQIKVYTNTNLYKLPSRQLDEQNQKILTFNEVSTLTVIQNDVNNNYIANQDKFLLVQTQSGEIGFVEVTRTLATSGIQEMVTNNATIKKETNVYLEADSSSDIIDTLTEGQRVRIEPNQQTNAKFLKVTYNNSNGDEITGYILADNVSRDTWTVLQIIGLIFVALNVIFLIILLCVKKKINND